MTKRRKLYKVFASIICGIIANLGIVEATITVSGTQSGTWFATNSPYIVTGTVTVDSGNTLTIEPGVIVKFATDTLLLSYGKLLGEGNPEGIITFTSNNTIPQAGDWKNIKLKGSGANGSKIKYCKIEYANQGIYLDNVYDGIEIMYNNITNNQGKKANNPAGDGGVGCGIYLFSATNTIIRNNTISDTIGGQGGDGGWAIPGGRGGIGAGIYLSEASIGNTISGNTILRSNGGKGGLPGSWSSSGPDGIGHGIYISQDSFNNIIDSNNTYNGQPILYFYKVNSVVIENQTLTGSPTTNLGKIVLIECNNFMIKNNKISNVRGNSGICSSEVWVQGGKGDMGVAIYLNKCSYGTVTENIISEIIGGKGGIGGDHGKGGAGGTGTGIYLFYSNHNFIINNKIFDNIGGNGGIGSGGPGLGYDGGDGGNGIGIYLSSSSYNQRF